MQHISPLDTTNLQQHVPTDFRQYNKGLVRGLGKKKKHVIEPVSSAVRHLLKEGMKSMPRGYKKPRAERKHGGALKRAGGALKVAGGGLATEVLKIVGPHLGAFIIDRVGKVVDKMIAGTGVYGGAAAPKIKQVQHRLSQAIKRGDKTVQEFSQMAAKSHSEAVANLFLDPNVYGKRTRDVAARKATDHIEKINALAVSMTESMTRGLENIVALLAEGQDDGSFIDDLADRLRTELERVVELKEFLTLAHEDKMQDYTEKKQEEREEKISRRKTPTRSKRPITEKQKQALAAGREKRAQMRKQE